MSNPIQLNFRLLVKLIIILMLFPSTAYTQSAFFEQWINQKQLLQNVSNDCQPTLSQQIKLAVTYAHLGYLEEALTIHNYIEKNYSPNNVQIYRISLEEQVGQNPNDPLLLGELGFVFLFLNQFELAKEYFQRSFDLDNSNVWLYNYLAATLLTLRQNEEAKELITAGQNIQRTQLAHILLGLTYYSEGSYARAAWHFLRSGPLLFSIRQLI